MRKALVALLLIASLFAFVSCKDVKYTDEIASLNGVVYSSLQKAIDDAADGDTVKLLCNATGKGAEIGSSITLDFGGHTYTFDDNVEIGTKVESLPEIGLRVKSGVEVTLKDAKLEAVDTFTAPFISSEGTLKLEETTIAPAVGKIALDVLAGKVNVDTASSVSGVVNIEGDSAEITFDEAPEEVVYTGSVSTATITYGETKQSGIIDAKFAIGNKGYETLATALVDLKTGDILSLLENLDLTTTLELDKDCTINLNGFDISANGFRAIHVKKGNVEITGKGKILANGDGLADNSSVIRVGQNDDIAASLTIGKDVVVSTDKCYGISIFNGKSGTTPTKSVSLTVNGKVESKDVPAISGCGNGYNGDTFITIGSTAEISTENENAIYFPCAGELTVNGKVTGKGGIEMKSGATTVSVGSNAKIVATAETTGHTPSGDGSSTSGYAFVIANNSGYKGGATATINGGTIIGTIAIVDDNQVAAEKKGKISITGGSFTMDVTDFVATGYNCTKVESTWTVGPAK